MEKLNIQAVRDWLKTLAPASHFYCGKLDRKQPKSVGVYLRTLTGRGSGMALGGTDATKTAMLPVSILIHWTENPTETVTAGQTLYDSLCALDGAEIGCKVVDYLRLRTDGPVDVGTDEAGVCECVIWLDIYYQKG